METLVNSNIKVDIELIDKISGGNQLYEVYFTATNKVKYKIVFDFAWDMRCAVENAYIDRFYHFQRKATEDSSVLLVINSEYIKYFESQVSGTRPIDDLKNFIMFDKVDTVIEILTNKEPTLIRLESSKE